MNSVPLLLNLKFDEQLDPAKQSKQVLSPAMTLGLVYKQQKFIEQIQTANFFTFETVMILMLIAILTIL